MINKSFYQANSESNWGPGQFYLQNCPSRPTQLTFPTRNPPVCQVDNFFLKILCRLVTDLLSPPISQIAENELVTGSRFEIAFRIFSAGLKQTRNKIEAVLIMKTISRLCGEILQLQIVTNLFLLFNIKRDRLNAIATHVLKIIRVSSIQPSNTCYMK